MSGETPQEKLQRNDRDLGFRPDVASGKDADKKKKVDGADQAADEKTDQKAAKRMGALSVTNQALNSADTAGAGPQKVPAEPTKTNGDAAAANGAAANGPQTAKDAKGGKDEAKDGKDGKGGKGGSTGKGGDPTAVDGTVKGGAHAGGKAGGAAGGAAGAKGKPDAKEAASGGGGGKVAAVDAVDGGGPSHTPTIHHADPAVRVAAPAFTTAPNVQLIAPANVSKSASDKWLKETGRTPDMHHAEIEAAVNALQSEVKTAQTEFEGLSTSLATKIEADIAAQTAGFASSMVAPGRARVMTAYGNIGKTVDGTATKALQTITQHKEAGAKTIAQTQIAKQVLLSAKIASGRAGVEAAASAHAPEAVAVLEKFSGEVLPQIDAKKAEAKAKVLAEVRAMPFGTGAHRGPAAYAGGKKALVKDVYSTMLNKVADVAVANYDAALRPMVTDIKKNGPTWVKIAIRESSAQLEFALDAFSAQATDALKKTGENATKTLNEQEIAARKSVADAKIASAAKIETDKKAALDTADSAGKALTDNSKAAGTELADRLKQRAGKDAAGYSAIVTNLQHKLTPKRGPMKAEDAQKHITAARGELTALHTANTSGLRQMATGGTADLTGTLKKQQDIYSAAIVDRESAATKTQTEITKMVTQGAEDLGTSIAGFGTAFDTTTTASMAKIDGAIGEFNLGAGKVLSHFTEQLTLDLNAKREAAEAGFKEAFATGFKDRIAPEAEKEIKSKEDQAITDAGSLREAFDGWGTKESTVFSVLRKCSPGQIEMVQGSYNEHYNNRGEGSGMTPLEYDIDDEMSGSEFKIAMGYLNHDRAIALKLELAEASMGSWMGTADSSRVEAVLRSCTEADVKTLNSDPSSVAIVNLVRHQTTNKSDLDVMNTLLDAKLKPEERKTRADAILLFKAMKGPGTDEAKMTEILEGATDKGERIRLREQFNRYAAERDGSKYDATKTEDNDALAEWIKDDTSDGEKAVFLELAKADQDKGVLNAAKMQKAADGGGTDETALFDALEDEKYAEDYAKASDADKITMAVAHKAKIDENLGKAKASYSGYEKLKAYDSIDSLLDGETEKSYTWDELKAGRYADPAKGLINTAQEKIKLQILDRNVGSAWRLEYMVAQAKVQTGTCPPELLLAYACWGVTGTDEDLINKVLSKQGKPRPRSEIHTIVNAFKGFWGIDLIKKFEIEERKQGDVGGVLDDELGGKDWFKTRILLCGIPQSPWEDHFITTLRYDYATSGKIGGVIMDIGEAIGATEAKSTLANTKKNEEAAYSTIKDKGLEETNYDESAAKLKKETEDANAKGEKPSLESLSTASTLEEFQRLSKYMEQDTEAYAKTVSAIVDAIVMVIEIIGGILISIGSMGAGTPWLFALLWNLALSATTIGFKAAALGDQYGQGDFGADLVAAVGTAGFAALGETKMLKNMVAGWRTKIVGERLVVATEGAVAKGGMQFVQAEGGWALQLSQKGVEKAQRIIDAGLKNVVLGAGQEVYSTLTNEKTYDMKIDEALFGENSLGKRLLFGAPKAFVQGSVTQWVNELHMTYNQNNPTKGATTTPTKNGLTNAMAEMAGVTAGFFVYPDSYEDAEQFWLNLFKQNAQAGLSGWASGYLMHKTRARNLAAEYLRKDAGPEDLEHQWHILDDVERKKIGESILKYGTDEQKAALPEDYRKAANAKPDPHANTTTNTNTKTTTTTTEPTITTGDQQANDLSQNKPIVHDDETVKKPVVPTEDESKKKPVVTNENENKKPVDDETVKKPVVANENEGETKKTVTTDEETAKKKPAVTDEEVNKTKPVVTEDEAKTKKTPADDEKAAKAVADELANKDTKDEHDANVEAKKPGAKLPATTEEVAKPKPLTPEEVKTIERRSKGEEAWDAIQDQVAKGEREWNGKNREEFIKHYEDGWEIDPDSETRRWKKPGTKQKSAPRFPDDATPESAFKQLKGKGEGGRDKSFKAFAEMLNARGITDETIIKDLGKLGLHRSEDLTRHMLKEQYKKTLLAELTSPEGIPELKKKYPTLDWTKSPAEAHKEASHQEMLAITKNLGSSDKGNMTEEWYRHTFMGDVQDPKSIKHIEVPAGTVEGEGKRVLDLVKNGEVHEIKSTDAMLSPGDQEQIAANLKFVGKQVKDRNGDTVDLKSVVVVITSPEGAQKNLGLIIEMLGEKANVGKLKIEVFDAKGQKHTISSLKDLDDPKFDFMRPVAETPAKKPVVTEDQEKGKTKVAATETGATTTTHPTNEANLEIGANSEAISTRAKAMLANLDPVAQKHATEVMGQAKGEVQKNMLERALAAGRSGHELEQLRLAMSGMSDAEVAHAFTGNGVVQFYQQSCVPTAYQIAIADVDPFYAFKLRNHPEMVMDQQRKVLIDNGASQTKRQDIIDNEPKTQLKPHLEDASMGKKLNDDGSYGTGTSDLGIQTTGMTDSELHKQLEKATGQSYEVLTNASQSKNFKTPGAGEYPDRNGPHERIKAAVEKGLPVIIAQAFPGSPGSHAMVIVGHTVAPDGVFVYSIRDPMSGTTSQTRADHLDAWGMITVTLPKSAVAPTTQVAKPAVKETTEKTTTDKSTTGTVGDEKAVKKPAVVGDGHDATIHPTDEQHPAKKNASWSDDERQLEKPVQETEEAARSRRSEGVKPSKDADTTKWATPEARAGVPETVPLTRQELRDLVTEKYHATMKKYLENTEVTNSPEYKDLIKRLSDEKPGSIGKEDAKKYLEEWGAINKKIEASTGRSENDLRTLYALVEQEDFPAWYEQLKHLPLEQQAKIGHMWRQEWKIYVRDMMTDESSKEVLYLRDKAMSGDRRGASFEDLFNRNLKKADATEESAHKGIIKTSMTSNPDVNKMLSGNEGGIEAETAKKIRATAVEPTGEKKYDSKGQLILPDDHATHTGGGTLPVVDEKQAAAQRTKAVLDEKIAKIEDIHKRLASDDEAVRVRAQTELDALHADPEYKDALALKGIFETADKHQKVGPDTAMLSDNIPSMLAEADKARVGKDPVLQGKRDKFERAIAMAILDEKSPVRALIDEDLKRMCDKAHDYITKMVAADEQAKAFAELGTDVSKGYGGGVGKNTEVMLEILKSGNIRERMLALGNVMTLMGTHALSADGRAKLEAIAAKPGEANSSSFTPADAKRLVDRVLKLDADLANDPKGKRDGKTLFNPNSEEKAGRHADYASAKAEGMDTKLPPLIAEKVAEFLGRQVAADGTGHTPKGEDNQLARTTITVREAIAMGLNLSEREIQAAGGLEKQLNWVVGSRANLVNPKAPFIAVGSSRVDLQACKLEYSIVSPK